MGSCASNVSMCGNPVRRVKVDRFTALRYVPANEDLDRGRPGGPVGESVDCPAL